MGKRSAEEVTWSEGQLPQIFAIDRIVSEVLPQGCTLSDQAMDELHAQLWAFLGSLVQEATVRIDREGRKAFSVDDVTSAVQGIGFTRYNDALREHLMLLLTAEDERKQKARASEGV